MRVAALYDVHGMHRALASVLDEVQETDADLVVFGGDLVEGPFPRETLALARSVEARFLRGNCEREPSPFVRERLAAGDLAWLSQLPPAMTLEGVLYCHGTPRSDDEIITAATPLDRLREVVRDVDPELIICGHTHHQFERRVDGHRLVNPGSVGMPYEDDVAAFWALVGEDDVEFRRSEFDVQAAAEEIKESGWTDAELFVLENMLGTPSREQAIAEFESRT